ncbi:hypothetical protein ACTJJ0_29085 [Chitinophaga sp. 22321]|uniref:MG2 domain-containing protein n=1 Tax=Chitinophaga hostae TaxID=2831022 RepID=A0ABS5J783_9BACT|nr:hypothetical protein [Chitinophaga hostae]MBS0031049.1 hypothetical protein [Chitinophaga hostae]
MRRQTIYLLLLLYASLPCFSQQPKIITDSLAAQVHNTAANLPVTNIYLHTDRGIYEAGEEIWFKSYLLDAQYLALLAVDKILYVMLQKKDNDSTVWQEMYPVKNGMVNGQVYLDGDLPEGDYWLKAWSANSFDDSPSPCYALRRIRVVKDKYPPQKKTAISKNTNGKIRFNLFPEGGRLVAGISNLVAFSATDTAGTPVNVAGTLLKQGNPVTRFSTRHAGMGSFTFTPDYGVAYTVRLQPPSGDTTYPLPAVNQTGITMHLLKNNDDSLSLRVTRNTATTPQRIYVRLQTRGIVQLIAIAMLSDSLVIGLPLQSAPEGMAAVTLFDTLYQPLAERLVYLHPNKKLHISYQLTKSIYLNREKVTLNIRTTDQTGKPVAASLCLNVSGNNYQQPQDDKEIDNHYYLSSQLKDNLYHPAWYFDENNKDREPALDLLLLTQHPKSYVWKETTSATHHQQVVADYLTGHLILSHNKRKAAKSQSILLAFDGDQRYQQAFTPDSTGRFLLDSSILAMGAKIYVKQLAESDAGMEIANPFTAIKKAAINKTDIYPLAIAAENNKEDAFSLPPNNRFHKTLTGVQITAKGGRTTWPKYLGILDSIAKLDGNTDYLGECGVINCPACHSNKKPIEGKHYSEYIGNRRHEIFSHPYAFMAEEMKQAVYHYRTFTEEELLKKFRLATTKGYYRHQEFYQPDYDTHPDAVPDFRKTLVWLPEITTNQQGEVSVSFFCSDIYGGFTGKIEGVSEQGLIGKKTFELQVVSGK